MFRSLARCLPLALALTLASSATWAQSLSKTDLQRMFPTSDIDSLTPAELEICLKSSQWKKVKTQLDRCVPEAAGPAAPADSPADAGPGFEDLKGAQVAPVRLDDQQMAECFTPERLAKMSPRTRERWRTHDKLLKFYGFYKAGRFTLEALRSLVAGMYETERPELVTKSDQPLRQQFPIAGKNFVLDLPTSTAWLFIEKDRKQNQRDQQIANVLWALRDDDNESDIGELLGRVAKLQGGKGAPKPVRIVLNLKMTHRGNIATFDMFKVISLGLDNPWLAPTQNLRYLRSVICHELGHFLQDELYGWKPAVGLIARFAGLRHNPEVTTNEQTALSEGWGDFCGLTFGKTDYWDWQEGYRHEGYDEKKPLKSRHDLLRTEGCVTQTLLIANEKIGGFREKVLATLGRHKPVSLVSLVAGFITDHPADGRILRAAMEEVLKGSK